MSLSPQQIQQMNQLTGLNKPVTPVQKINQTRIAQLQAIAKQAPVKPDPLASVHIGGSANSLQNIKDAASAGADQINEGVTDIQKGSPGHNPIVGGVEDALKVGSGIASVVTSPIAGIFKPVSDIINTTGNAVGNIPAIQDFANSKAGETTARVASDVANAGNIAGTILGADQIAKAAPGAIDTVKNTASDAVGAVKDALTTTPEESAATKASAEATAKAQTATKLKGIADEWAKPTTVPKATYNNAKLILQKDPTIPKFLADVRLNPWEHIENGNYATADTANTLRTTAGQLSRDTLRPSLQAADYSTPKTSVKDLPVSDKAIQEQGRGVTPDDTEAIQEKIQSKIDSLNRKYPNGMSLTDMHDEGITYDQNGKFSPVKDPSVDNNAIANRVLARTLRNQVLAKAPKDIPVQDFQNSLSQYYKAADYLDALNNKKAPVSLLQNIAHRGAEVIGAAVGHGFGGGILGGVGGYMIGGALEHALENMTTSMRGSFLRNLETSNPEAFTKVQEYLNKTNSGGTGQLRLPAATSESPIPLGPDTTTPAPSVAPYAAKTPLPTANPKTGRMQTTYTSMPK